MAGLSAQFVVLLMSLCFFALCDGTEEVTVETGENVTLECQGPRDESITVIEWSRPDLESDGYVFFFRHKKTDESSQHRSFHGRVELRDPEMKNGDASVILKNVTVNDTGTYECFVRTRSGGRRRRDADFNQLINLKVTDPGHTAGHTEEGGDKEGGDKEGGHEEGRNHTFLSVVAVICVVGLVGFVLWKRQRPRKGNSPPAADEAAELQTSSSSNHCV